MSSKRTEHWCNGTYRGKRGNRRKLHSVHQISKLAVRNSYTVYTNSVSLLQNGYRLSFPEIKVTVRGVDYALPFSVEVEERVEVSFFSPSAPSWPVMGEFYLLPLRLTIPSLRYSQQSAASHFKTFNKLMMFFLLRITWQISLQCVVKRQSLLKTPKYLIQVLITVT
jgi:hypothetical protein